MRGLASMLGPIPCGLRRTGLVQDSGGLDPVGWRRGVPAMGALAGGGGVVLVACWGQKPV